MDPDGRYLYSVIAILSAADAYGVLDAGQDGIDAMDYGRSVRDNQQKTIDCMFDKSCSGEKAKRYCDDFYDDMQSHYKKAASATYNAAKSVPGTSVTGALPGSQVDLAAGYIVGELL
ncbi:hypothetical protein [Vibrio vulnificus]|uniref:hypothetical protein n=1 Tax=Vibrio vulnificus TaxID=672 RepID=UPI0040598AD9